MAPFFFFAILPHSSLSPSHLSFVFLIRVEDSLLLLSVTGSDLTQQPNLWGLSPVKSRAFINSIGKDK